MNSALCQLQPSGRTAGLSKRNQRAFGRMRAPERIPRPARVHRMPRETVVPISAQQASTARRVLSPSFHEHGATLAVPAVLLDICGTQRRSSPQQWARCRSGRVLTERADATGARARRRGHCAGIMRLELHRLALACSLENAKRLCCARLTAYLARWQPNVAPRSVLFALHVGAFLHACRRCGCGCERATASRAALLSAA